MGHSRPHASTPFPHSTTSAALHSSEQSALPAQHTKQPVAQVAPHVALPVQESAQSWSHVMAQSELPVQAPPQESTHATEQSEPPAQSIPQFPALEQSTSHVDCPSQEVEQSPSWLQSRVHDDFEPHPRSQVAPTQSTVHVALSEQVASQRASPAGHARSH